MDNFYEQLLTTKEHFAYKIANVLMYLIVILGVAGLILGKFLLFIVFVLTAVGIFFFKKNLFIEYEYIFTNGEIDIDKIFEMKKRKRIISFNIKDVQIIAKDNSQYIKDFINKPNKVINLYPPNYNGEIFVAILNKGAETIMIKFAPDEKILNLAFKYNPRAIKKS
ncbi:DUF6106 family protein [Clostridium algidicarnis]|uniref:DUF6106 family protein n=1 Tax=Clostridium algidicarnis TaxID=37659 RepID=UPI001C0AEF85|nr:DUF6106 family protein [Clostridium algidicarnis]MBU3227152.1 hypothetical protein [Clostridium algidicarnis]MBU3250677.1 hypothetical protein [Clostridium algidicarnis]